MKAGAFCISGASTKCNTFSLCCYTNEKETAEYPQKVEADLESEYLPEGGHRIGGLVDDHGIAQIARDLTAAEQEIKDLLYKKYPLRVPQKLTTTDI